LQSVPRFAQPSRPALIVLAKAPVAGWAKTRLSPPLRPAQAALLAEAALLDTLAAVLATAARRRVLVLDGEPGGWLPAGFELLAQRDGDLSVRLADAFAEVGEAALLIGMDTPQVSPSLLDAGLDALLAEGTDAVIGHTLDGGYWTIGLRDPDRRVFAGVPMSTPHTGAAQSERLDQLGLRTATLAVLRDVDLYDVALAHAEIAGAHTQSSGALPETSEAHTQSSEVLPETAGAFAEAPA
jgi:glycosyltransferase A (GT-A) superfamily protein (DUF2064 family)